jgi:hypothetical protein
MKFIYYILKKLTGTRLSVCLQSRLESNESNRACDVTGHNKILLFFDDDHHPSSSSSIYHDELLESTKTGNHMNTTTLKNKKQLKPATLPMAKRNHHTKQDPQLKQRHNIHHIHNLFFLFHRN